MIYLKLFEDYKNDDFSKFEDALLPFIDDKLCELAIDHNGVKVFKFESPEYFEEAKNRLEKFNIKFFTNEKMHPIEGKNVAYLIVYISIDIQNLFNNTVTDIQESNLDRHKFYINTIQAKNFNSVIKNADVSIFIMSILISYKFNRNLNELKFTY